MTKKPNKAPSSGPYSFFNYCVCFMDLLGQREALKGHKIIHNITEEAREKFIQSAKSVIGPIVALQERTTTMKNALDKQNSSQLRDKLPKNLRPEWDQMRKMRLRTQYWSDGLMAFASLGDAAIKCPMNAVFSIFAMAGSECLIGLGVNAPIRGAIDIAWGIELKPGELYGAAVANAYELESSFAQYPRMLVSEQTIDFLKAQLNRPEQDNFAEHNREIAQICLDMLLRDIDGRYILHYLGDKFRAAVTQGQHPILYNEAREFVVKEYERFRKAADTKHALRYHSLLNYFEHFPPKAVQPDSERTE